MNKTMARIVDGLASHKNAHSPFTMKRTASLVGVLTFILTAQLPAEPPIDPQEAAIVERFGRLGPKTLLPRLLQYNVEKLEAVYQQALKDADDDELRKAIEASQQAWQKFYEADSNVAYWNAQGGSYAYPAQAEQKLYQLRVRMYQLSTPFLQGWKEVPRVPNPKVIPVIPEPAK
jgi:hypothetical protein